MNNNRSNKTIKAGGIIVKKENGNFYVLLIYRKKEDDWSFPKGHIEHGEDVIDTLKREILEETGLKVEIVKELEPNKYINSRAGEETVTYMFLLRPTTEKLKPEHKGDKVEWVKLNKVRDKLSYDNLKDYFCSVQKKHWIYY